MSAKLCMPVLIFCALLGTACNRGPKMVPVQGVITLDGQPVEDAAVMFYLKAGGRPATGTTDSAGRYSLTTSTPNDGALEGAHTVVVSKYRTEGSSGTNTPEGAVSGSGVGTTIWPVPERYSHLATSGLDATVSRAQAQYNFELKSQP